MGDDERLSALERRFEAHADSDRTRMETLLVRLEGVAVRLEETADRTGKEIGRVREHMKDIQTRLLNTPDVGDCDGCKAEVYKAIAAAKADAIKEAVEKVKGETIRVHREHREAWKSWVAIIGGMIGAAGALYGLYMAGAFG